jgi:hypothetical protein
VKHYRVETSDDFEVKGRNRFRAVDTKKMVELVAVKIDDITHWIDKEEYGDYRGEDKKQGV